eukprot:scaffold194839_cov18-Tisochrysis_lutea.AAC.1
MFVMGCPRGAATGAADARVVHMPAAWLAQRRRRACEAEGYHWQEGILVQGRAGQRLHLAGFGVACICSRSAAGGVARPSCHCCNYCCCCTPGVDAIAGRGVRRGPKCSNSDAHLLDPARRKNSPPAGSRARAW